MRRTITVAAVAAIAVAGLAGTATAGTKPTVRQVHVWAQWLPDGTHISGVKVKIARSDNQSPAGIRICLQERASTKAAPRSRGCATVNAAGDHYFRYRENLHGGEQWRLYHAATATLGKYYGPWTYGTAGV